MVDISGGAVILARVQGSNARSMWVMHQPPHTRHMRPITCTTSSAPAAPQHPHQLSTRCPASTHPPTLKSCPARSNMGVACSQSRLQRSRPGVVSLVASFHSRSASARRSPILPEC